MMQFTVFGDQMHACKNSIQRNARIGSESILAFGCVAVSINMSTTQHNAGLCVVL